MPGVSVRSLPLCLALWLSACAHEGGTGAASDAPARLPLDTRSPQAVAAPVLIVNATLWTGNPAQPRIAGGTLYLRDGRIAAIGDRSIKVDGKVRVVDAGGRWVTPGIIDAHSHLGVYAAPEIPAHADGNEMTDPVTGDVAAAHGFWPQDPGLSHAAAARVTSLLVLPGSGNLVGGRGFAIKNRPGRSAAEMRFPGAPDVLKIACGENPKRVYGQQKRTPMSRMGNLAMLRGAFAKARDYAIKWQHWQERERNKGGKPPERDLELETLADVLAGKLLVQNHCYRADEMLLMLDVAREFGFSIRTFHHAIEAYKIADVLAKEDVAVATWADWWGFKMEAFDAIPENLALVNAAGGRAIVHSDSPIGVQRLNHHAAQGLAAGRELGLEVDEDDALAWVTRNPAWALGVQDETGTLEVGKMADVVLWSGHPLSIYSKAELVLVDGHVVFDRKQGRRPSDFELGTEVVR